MAYGQKDAQGFIIPARPRPIDYVRPRKCPKWVGNYLDGLVTAASALFECHRFSNSEMENKIPEGMTPLGGGREIDQLYLLSMEFSKKNQQRCNHVLAVFHFAQEYELPLLLWMASDFVSVEERAYALMRIRKITGKTYDELVEQSLDLDLQRRGVVGGCANVHPSF